MNTNLAPLPLTSRFANVASRREIFGPALVFIAFMLAWQWGPQLIRIPAYILPTASECWFEFLRMIGRDALFYHLAITAVEVLVGFVLGVLLGAFVGYILGLSLAAEIVLSPYILAVQIAPKVAFAPIFILWFGYTVTPKILVAVTIVFFPIMMNVLPAVRRVDRDLINLARSFSATRLQVFRKIEFRAAIPALFAGLRISSTLAVIGVVIGEFVGGDMGLGYLLTYGEGAANTPMVFVTIILLTIIGLAAYALVVWAERYVLRYIPTRNPTA
jgi:NitT/TauT family transport system permease protein